VYKEYFSNVPEGGTFEDRGLKYVKVAHSGVDCPFNAVCSNPLVGYHKMFFDADYLVTATRKNEEALNEINQVSTEMILMQETLATSIKKLEGLKKKLK
jgi:hypothetical protein